MQGFKIISQIPPLYHKNIYTKQTKKNLIYKKRPMYPTLFFNKVKCSIL